jgi:RHS repeat-associated protein
MTDAEGKTTQYQYDQQNRLVQVTDALGGATNYGYQTGCPDCGRSDLLSSLTDAKGNTTSFSYDAMGRVIGITDPLGFQKLFSYDPNGNLLLHTDPNGNTLTYTYDLANRLTGKTLPDDVVTYGYDLLDNLTAIADNDSSISMSYDLAGRLTSVTIGGSVLPVATISYTYDANGNRVSMVDKENGVTYYQYDSLSRLVSLLNPEDEAVSFGYDALDRRMGLNMPNGVQVGYSYDAASRLLTLIRQINGGNIANFTYNHDKVGNRTSMTDLSGTHAYGYDQLYRLISATHTQPSNPVELYTYDAVGNRLSSAQYPTWSYDANNRLLSFNGTNFTYNNNGNRISKTDASGTTTYHYDSENRLIGIDKPDGAVITYRYDPFGRRIEKNVNGTITRYLYDGEDILYELDGSNTILARYTHGPGIDEPLIMERDAANYYYHADGLGSITHITDAAGNIVQSYVYSAFGEIVTQEGGLSNPFTYISREYDPESGLYYYRARYYDAEVGRFLQTDPIGFAGGDANLYAYVGNNPINWVDPLGLWSISIEGYYGWGGGIVFGTNPGGGRFITFRVGYGIGGGIGYDPKGASPGWDPCKKHGLLNVGVGGYGAANVGLGPFYAGYNVAGGYNIENPAKNYGYFSHGLSYGLDYGFRLRGGIAGGGELTFY